VCVEMMEMKSDEEMELWQIGPERFDKGVVMSDCSIIE
jgi:hypothetical protein